MLKQDVILSRADSIWRFLTPHPTANGKVSASENMTKACALLLRSVYQEHHQAVGN